ncbi:MAG: type I secretion system permease/ATPase, partial [Selenomonadaceae bacterium]|nr:type I secretion system permease/ATPase [Selenomonadaceae bacterium]
MSDMSENRADMPVGMTGLISLLSIFGHFGIKLNQKEFLKENEANRKDISLKQIMAISRRKKLRSEHLRPTADELREIELPVMALMNNGCYVVIAARTDEAVFLIDPRMEHTISLSYKKFLESWQGDIIAFSGKLNWSYFKKRYNLPWFYMVIKRYKKQLTEVFAAAFFLQLMGIGMPLITQVIIDKVISNHGEATLNVIGVSMVIFLLMQSVLTGLRTYIMSHTTLKLDAILGSNLFRHLLSLPLPYYESRRVGDTMMRISALNSIREFLTGQTLTTILDV